VTSSDRIAALRSIMVKHDLKRGDVARMLGLTPRPGGSHGTVDGWLSGVRGMPAAKLELIWMKAPGWKTTRQVV
jgi:hypothetical protein